MAEALVKRRGQEQHGAGSHRSGADFIASEGVNTSADEKMGAQFFGQEAVQFVDIALAISDRHATIWII